MKIEIRKVDDRDPDASVKVLATGMGTTKLAIGFKGKRQVVVLQPGETVLVWDSEF